MSAWAMPLLAVVVAALAVLASVIIPRLDRSNVRPADSARTAPDVTFTVIDDADASPTPSTSPSPPPAGPLRRAETPEETDAPARPPGPRRVTVQSGEIAEDSTDQKLEEEEEEQRREEAEERAKAREDRQNRDD